MRKDFRQTKQKNLLEKLIMANKDASPLLIIIYNRPAIAWLLMVIVGIMFWLMVGCTVTNGVTVTDMSGSRYFYNCELPRYWVEHVNKKYDVHVLPWKEFGDTLWALGFSAKGTRALISGKDIYLREDYSLDNYYHEIAHSYDFANGNYDNHSPVCWSTSRPWEYDQTVLTAFEGLDLPFYGRLAGV